MLSILSFGFITQHHSRFSLFINFDFNYYKKYKGKQWSNGENFCTEFFIQSVRHYLIAQPHRWRKQFLTKFLWLNRMHKQIGKEKTDLEPINLLRLRFSRNHWKLQWSFIFFIIFCWNICQICHFCKDTYENNISSSDRRKIIV